MTHAVALSLTETEIVPIDTEGQSIMATVPVLGWNQPVKPGCLGEEIAQALSISYETVKEHVQHILRKVGVSDRTQAAVWAVRKGLV